MTRALAVILSASLGAACAARPEPVARPVQLRSTTVQAQADTTRHDRARPGARELPASPVVVPLAPPAVPYAHPRPPQQQPPVVLEVPSDEPGTADRVPQDPTLPSHPDAAPPGSPPTQPPAQDPDDLSRPDRMRDR